ncbi:hybrid sensor histidine kinase/response regulator [Desulfosudis oleivorans]|uniref:histidine kinase n=1 Tax=Desulfosudis oleivorans (strain DSM 6200 / JCM 39069 / Hxd3) TaxID=96561 RepID=A8ZUX2_DESOH|nr:ATP-binding protein [Desulfosudis oleivorans]ABW68062.1 multi-sensor signal transduction histidine kinase [Desulfosudis oleivorans Hxd3]
MQNDAASGSVAAVDINGTIGGIVGSLVLAEPEADLRDALEIHLTRLGLHVHKAGNGQAALNLLKEQGPSFLLANARLPDMSGIDLLRLSQAVSPNTAVIIMGDPADRKSALAALRLKATDYIHIPVESEHLEVALTRAAHWRTTRVKIQHYVEQLEALHQTKVLFQQLFDEVPCYISIQDKHFRLTGANRRFKEDFGDTIGSICYEVYKHRSEPCRDCPVMGTFEDGQPRQTEEVVTSKSGEKINVLTWTAPIHDAAGQITQVMEMATDITQIRKLQSRLTSIGLLMSSISHSIKGLLTALDGAIYRLDSGLEKQDMDRVRDGADRVKEMVAQIRKMVLNVLYYTKERQLNWARINVRDFTRDVVSIIGPKAEAAGVTFTHNLSSGLGAFEVDPGALRSALINILENCIDACVDDKSGNDRKHEVTLKVTDRDDHVVYEIQDNGVGMDQETREKMFTLFFSSKGSRGTGLGMFVADQIIGQHGGSIDVDSEPGSGSTFTVRLPRILPQEIRQPADADTGEPDHASHTE